MGAGAVLTLYDIKQIYEYFAEENITTQTFENFIGIKNDIVYVFAIKTTTYQDEVDNDEYNIEIGIFSFKIEEWRDIITYGLRNGEKTNIKKKFKTSLYINDPGYEEFLNGIIRYIKNIVSRNKNILIYDLVAKYDLVRPY